jgi:hypothetical protein
MKSKILLWLGVPELSARLTAAESTITTLKQFQQQQHSRIVQLETTVAGLQSQAAGHVERISRVERAHLPVRYVITPTGLQEVR